VPNGVYVAKSFEDAVSILFRKPLSDSVERIFIIGGASVYEVSPLICSSPMFSVHPLIKKMHQPKLLQNKDFYSSAEAMWHLLEVYENM